MIQICALHKIFTLQRNIYEQEFRNTFKFRDFQLIANLLYK